MNHYPFTPDDTLHEWEADRANRTVRHLFDLADYLSERPHLAARYLPSYNIVALDPDEFAQFIREAGSGNKEAEGGFLVYTVNIPSWVDDDPEFTLSIICSKAATCERVQIGTRLVEVDEVVETRKVLREEPVYEFRCPDSWLSLDHNEQAHRA
jgi:hypothetical protein